MQRIAFPRLVVLSRTRIDPAIHLSRPLGGGRAPDEPDQAWVAVATGRRSGAFILAERDGVQAHALVAQATANLSDCPHQWSVSATRGFLCLKRPSLLRAYGDPMVPVPEMATMGSGVDDFSSDLVLRADVMASAAVQLRSTSLFVAIPKRGWLMVGAGQPGNLAAMRPMHGIADGIAGRGGHDAITTRVLFFDGATLTGWSTLGPGGGALTLGVRDIADPWDLG